ncbi:acetyl-CoA acetyltransferase [Corynebacterium sp. TAE3-ERU30]|uniref:acetyl-CoA acetyltransferase n=1 Tax=Corynebacterium sp. TAE3-ERU30 TaxID=2849496 RepID=UPI001C466F6B|nr:acetyl-CoA acetyltransferase [Corynebacterium sp. TAE3-ERU30]MBV7282630.1 acetyl-CoA acetyltransferase [Corynebacterium sp. TAE3-ERU30]
MPTTTYAPQSQRSTIIEYHRRPTPASTHTPIPAERTTSRTFAEDPFRARFGHRLPRGLREEARGMEWRTFAATYAPLGDMRITHLERENLRGGRYRYTAHITDTSSGARIDSTREIIATGACSAVTNLLADMGRRVEILSYHQFEIFEATVTFIYTCENNKRAWAMGFGPTSEASVAAALSTAAARLHG